MIERKDIPGLGAVEKAMQAAAGDPIVAMKFVPREEHPLAYTLEVQTREVDAAGKTKTLLPATTVTVMKDALAARGPNALQDIIAEETVKQLDRATNLAKAKRMWADIFGGPDGSP
jgi:hypothetical protein